MSECQHEWVGEAVSIRRCQRCWILQREGRFGDWVTYGTVPEKYRGTLEEQRRTETESSR